MCRKNGIEEYETYDMFCASCDCGNKNLDSERSDEIIGFNVIRVVFVMFMKAECILEQ